MHSEQCETRGDTLGKRRHRSPLEAGSYNDEAGQPSLTGEEPDAKGAATKRCRLEVEEEPTAEPATRSTTLASSSSTPEVHAAPLTRVSPSSGPPTSGAPSRKRARLDTSSLSPNDNSPSKPDSAPKTQTPGTSPLLTIPPEIFSEIVLQTCSPSTALALSLTCKALHYSLSLPQSSFIWTSLRINSTLTYDWDTASLSHRLSRANLSEEGRELELEKEKQEKLKEMYGLPDWQEIEKEGGGWKGMLFKSEQEYVGFAFGVGVGAGKRKCEVCGEERAYGKAYASYALRISLCDNRTCRKTFISTHLVSGRHPRASSLGGEELHDSIRVQLEPQLRSEFKGAPGEFNSFSRDSKPIYRKDISRYERVARSVLGEKDEGRRDEIVKRERIRVDAWMKLCNALALWRRRTREYYCKVKNANDNTRHRLAQEHDWNPEDLLNCTDYGPFHRYKNHVMEKVTDKDVQSLLPTIHTQMTLLIAKRTRSAQDAVYHTFRDQITSYHKHLIKQSASYDPFPRPHSHSYYSSSYSSNKKERQNERDIYPIVPALSAFRDLEIMSMLQSTSISLPSPNFVPPARVSAYAYPRLEERKSTSWRDAVKEVVKRGDVGRSLRGDKVLGVVVRDQVGARPQAAEEGMETTAMKEIEKAAENVEGASPATGNLNKAEAAEVDMDTDEAEEESTDPEYFTSRFRCTKCQVYDSAYAEDECLDFKGVCTHECTVNGKKGNGKAKWSLGNFERDEKAISVLKKLEKAVKEQFPRGALDKNMVDKYLGLSFDTWDKKREPHVWDTKVLCMSCESPILMDGKSAIGHSHRHEDMQLSFVWSDTRTTHLSEEVQELLKVYRGKYPMVKRGTTKEMMGKSWKSRPAKAKKPQAVKEGEIEGETISNSKDVNEDGKKGKGKGKKKDNGEWKFGRRVRAKGKGKAVAPLSKDAEGETGEGGETEEKDGKKKDDDRKFACRHCHNAQFLADFRAARDAAAAQAKRDAEAAQAKAMAQQSLGEGENAEASGSGGQGSPRWSPGGNTPERRPELTEKTPAWMGWNGLRSHLKAKHGIASVRDEDYFIKPEETGYSSRYYGGGYGVQVHFGHAYSGFVFHMGMF